MRNTMQGNAINPAPAVDLNALERDLLVAVAAMDEPHGLGICEHLEDAGYRRIGNSQLYQRLDRLVEDGLVEKGESDGRTNWYRLTERGRRELIADAKWREESTERNHQKETTA